MSKHLKPSLLKIIKTDFLSFFSFLSLVILPLLYLDLAYTHWLSFIFLRSSEPVAASPLILSITGLASSLAALTLVYRLVIITWHFKNGVTVQAQITGKYIRRQRGRVFYTYIYKGLPYSAHDYVYDSKAVKELKVKDLTSAVINPKRPTRAFLKTLYHS